jgi:hypothetical protein
VLVVVVVVCATPVSTGTSKTYFSGAGNNSMLKSYVNDTYSYKEDSRTIGFPQYNEPMIICANPNYYKGKHKVDQEFFDGQVYAIRMYTSVLSDEQMQKHNVIDKARYK